MTSDVTKRAVMQRTGYGALAIMVVVAVFLCDVWIAQLCEPPDLFLSGGQLQDVIQPFSNAVLDGPLGTLFRRGSVLPLFVLGVMLAGAIEFVRLAREKGARPFAPLIYVMVGALVLAPWFSAGGWLGARPAYVEGAFWSLVGVMLAVVAVAFMAVWRRCPENAFRDIGATLTIIMLLGFLGSFVLQLRCDRDIPGQEGAWLLLVVVLVTKASDIGAYFVGTALGRHKLSPRISPGKSIEGMIGGLAASALVALLIAAADVSRTFCMGSNGAGFDAFWQPVLFGVVISVTGQVGDLLESSFKRDAGSKDSGKVIPRFGGILDLIDSPMLAVPVAWFLLTEVWAIV